ncbi:VOC family protein [Sporosarcina sp. NPDC096371]|uniref:VOC family protein n=1 Tax=Sporosarcina sp. NPDC096371 TaxID=3364530 RepID=UPI0038159289
MTKQIWINLPVKDIKKSRAFFTKLGFSHNTEHGNQDDSAGFFIGDKNVVIMLFTEPTFKMFTRNEITDTRQSTEVLFSIDAESREEVDEMAKKAVEAGGTIFGEPEEQQGWMYGCGFADLDGHRWNVLYMDLSKMKTN